MKGSNRSSAGARVGSAMLARVAQLTAGWAGRRADAQLVGLGLLTWIGIQSYGRYIASNEFYDLGAVALTAIWLWQILGREPKRFPEASVRLGRLLGRGFRKTASKLASSSPSVGFDCVQEPPYPRGLPRIYSFTGMVIAALGLTFALRPWGNTLEAVAAARHWAYPAYLVAACGFTLLSLFVGLSGFVMPFVLVWNWASSTYRHYDERRTRVRRRASLGVAVLMVASIGWFPAQWAPSAVGFLTLAVMALLNLPQQPRREMIWRSRRQGEPYRSIDWRTLESLEVMLPAGICALLMTVPAVGIIDAAQREVAVISSGLRWFVCIGGLWLILGMALYRVHYALSVSLQPPSKRTPRRIRVRGGSKEEQAAAATKLRQDGWKVLKIDADPVRSDDVLLKLNSGAPVESPHFVDLSRAIAPALLDDPEIHWRLKRRADVRSRRSVMKGLKAIFKEAAAGRRGPGSGYIVAPHQWFMLGLARDVSDDDTTEDRSMEGFLQPEYRLVMTPRARHHLYLILQSAGVDMIYVEDGVGYRRLAQALRVIFDLFDKHGVDRRVSGRDFAAVYGVHAIVHDVTPDAPRQSDKYPEPEYDSGMRARILHLYRDRGGSDDRVDVPVETDGVPLLV